LTKQGFSDIFDWLVLGGKTKKPPIIPLVRGIIRETPYYPSHSRP
jgi:hypothetical protein